MGVSSGVVKIRLTLASHELKEGVRQLFARLSFPEYAEKAKSPTVADVKLIGAQTSEARIGDFTLRSDEPKSIGGGDSAPALSSIFVAAIGFAENVVFARQAAEHNFDFDSLETKVEAHWDRRGLFGIENIDPSITNVLIETRIATQATQEQVTDPV